MAPGSKKHVRDLAGWAVVLGTDSDPSEYCIQEKYMLYRESSRSFSCVVSEKGTLCPQYPMGHIYIGYGWLQYGFIENFTNCCQQPRAYIANIPNMNL